MDSATVQSVQPWTQDSILDSFLGWVKKAPDTPFLTENDRSWTFGEFEEWIARVARALDEIGRLARALVERLAVSGVALEEVVLARLEADLATVEQDLADARERIEVLEKIVTDRRYDLSQEIDRLEKQA